MKHITQQIIEVYKQLHPKGTLSDLEVNRYYTEMMAHARIEYIEDDYKLVGFIESWRLDYEQLGRVVCWNEFSALKENVTNGDIVYVSDMYINPQYRNTKVCKELISLFKETNKDAKHYVSRRVKLKTKYIKVYSKEVGYRNDKDNGKDKDKDKNKGDI